jgi:hypothetical protein
MIIYAITQDYEAPSAYYVSKAAAEWAIKNKTGLFNPLWDYVIEIEVIE